MSEDSESSGLAEETSTEKKEPAIEYVHTNNMPELLGGLGVSLLVSTYQAQRIMTISVNGDRLFMLMRVFERPTGLALQNGRLAAVTRRQVWFFEEPGQIRDLEGNVLPYDQCYVPRRSHVTGDISGHEAVWIGDQLIVVNTRFSCLCTLSPDWSFVPLWHPPFISEVVPEDRCHLNGIVADAYGPKYVTAFSDTDQDQSWRECKRSGGVVVDVPSGEVVARGMSMPHSPRLYAGRLWVLDSGTGSLQVVDTDSGVRTTVVQLPGYLRGLSFYDRYAFIGLCKIRSNREIFGGCQIEALEERKCAIYVIDITSGQEMGFIEFTKGIEELFDIHVLPGVKNPHIIGFEEDTINGIFVVQG